MVENQKVCRVIEEFSLYLLEAEVEDLNIKVSKTENRFSILFSCQKIADNLLEELDEIFKRKRQHEFEIYGWELIGQFTYYISHGKVYFNLVRYE